MQLLRSFDFERCMVWVNKLSKNRVKCKCKTAEVRIGGGIQKNRRALRIRGWPEPYFPLLKGLTIALKEVSTPVLSRKISARRAGFTLAFLGAESSEFTGWK